jgi:signal transduction histidine kinase
MKAILTSLLLLIAFVGKSQPEPLNEKLADSLITILPTLPNNKSRVDALNKLARMYTSSEPNLAIDYATEAIRLARELSYKDGLISGLGQSGFIKATISEWPQSMNELNEAMRYVDESDERMILLCGFMFVNYSTKGENEEGLKWTKRVMDNPLFKKMPDVKRWVTYTQTAMAYEGIGNLDSARKYANLCIPLIEQYGHNFSIELTYLGTSVLGSIALKEQRFSESLRYYKRVTNYVGMAKVFDAMNQTDSMLYYARLGLAKSQSINSEESIQVVALMLAKTLEEKSPAEAVSYWKIYIEARERQFNNEKLKQLEAMKLEEQQNTFESERKITTQRNFIIVSSIVGITLLSLGFLVFFIRNNKLIKVANQNLNKTLTNLKSTQAQLIQSEKMASLGELTAGIAHEIQNPLNFVNNFSEINTELIQEANREIEKGNISEVKTILSDLEGNEQKINHHGKRADAIVKGMLQHSRASSGQKELTDINALCDEYLRLSYHGFRAIDKSFNAKIETDFDASLPKINVVPQDIGRVILNLINNAFYAVSERSRQHSGNYEPTVTISTKWLNGKISIAVKDNGNGIPESIKEKIFQPFFTTKPTGQGTGLGLSLSYDIVKVHGGKLELEAQSNVGCIFTIKLPIP